MLTILKTRALLFFGLCCFNIAPGAAEKPKIPPPEAAVVKVLEKPLPAEAEQRGSFLFANFANKPEEQQFECYTGRRWKSNFSRFSKVIVQKAEAQGLDSKSLQRVFEAVLKGCDGHIALLPVGAYQTTLNGELVWVVPFKWESLDLDGKGVALSHIRVMAFEQKTCRNVGWTTCC